MRLVLPILLIMVLVRPISVLAETGHDAWLRYPPIERSYDGFPAILVVLGDTPILKSCQEELLRGLRGMLGRTERIERGVKDLPAESAVLIGTLASIRQLDSTFADPALKGDGYLLKTVVMKGQPRLVITALTERGVLYGTFALLRKIGLGQPVDALNEREIPYAQIRLLNHWDNLDGTIERGYAGRSIFWEDNHIVSDLSTVRDYARMMASLGINGCSINNVNADARVITTEYLREVARVAEVFRAWGVQLFISLDLASPRKIGGIDTFDPLDPRAVEFWKRKVDEIYGVIPDLGGFVLKADSEGRLGPSEYGRTHADAANTIARPLKAHNGVLFYRGFVYDHKMDWRDLKLDRARAAYDNFHKLDGTFLDNVVIQIKHGPIDFQVREPASPLFGGLEKTNQAIELQITQEYTGQQRHVCFLVPMWKEALDFDMEAKGPGTPVKALIAGKVFDRPTGGFVGVSNVGRSASWLANHLAVANLYGFGRLAWNPDLSSKQIAEEWTGLTFGNDPRLVAAIANLELQSWATYEHYTGPLGAGTLTDIIGIHYGPAVESSEYNGWGQWHRANETGIGMDRTVATGTGYIGQYRPRVAKMYESLETCPDGLLLFMHHVPYTHVLHSGKTVIQHIYDSHYQGVEEVRGFVGQWRSLKGAVDEQRYQEVLASLEYQAGHAQVWRDAICSWFLHKSGIADATGRAGHFPGRIEAESMKLDGYQVTEIKPWEAASGGKAITCPQGARCSASFRYDGQPGWYDLRVEYFDQNNGVSNFRLRVAGQVVAEWKANDTLPSRLMDAHSSTQRTIRGVALRPGDEIRIEGAPDGSEGAPVDYVEIMREK
jgi:alpha-glucuronidase